MNRPPARPPVHALPGELISTSKKVAAVCAEFQSEPFVAVDTEFMRERTFWPRLCLVQIAGASRAVAIDPLAPDLDLAPVNALMNAPSVLKVFHAARQDLEIFVLQTGSVPAPIFDTQIAAMVCGFGDSVGYDALARRLLGQRIEKESQFTDWARRPLRDRQLVYALNDVIHLRAIYQVLVERLRENGREHWLEEERERLVDPANFRIEPSKAWQRLKLRSRAPDYLRALIALADWREREAQDADQPRNQILRDEAIQELAVERPRNRQDMAKLRTVGRNLADGRRGQAVLDAIKAGESLSDEALPAGKRPAPPPPQVGPLVELLKVLLKARAERNDVVPRLIASADDLQRIALGDPDVRALHGWRAEAFGDDAAALVAGRLALAAGTDGVTMLRIEDDGLLQPADPPAPAKPAKKRKRRRRRRNGNSDSAGAEVAE